MQSHMFIIAHSSAGLGKHINILNAWTHVPASTGDALSIVLRSLAKQIQVFTLKHDSHTIVARDRAITIISEIPEGASTKIATIDYVHSVSDPPTEILYAALINEEFSKINYAINKYSWWDSIKSTQYDVELTLKASRLTGLNK
jgi:hypothetical protein